MTGAAARALRLDQSTWRRLAATATPAGAGLIVVGAYLVVAFDRFGLLGFFEVRATLRIILTGLYGWLWLVGAAWLIARWAFGHRGSGRSLVPLLGHSHLPLLLLAIFVQFVSVSLNTTGISIWPALLAVAFWMPAMLVAATATGLDLSHRRALVTAGVPYAVWLLVVGRSLWRQIGHLL